jgi:AraC family transcriptional regulator, regulatory protein of adaptative response / methylated-DNA-[protein]-cysteine methyltransferase
MEQVTTSVELDPRWQTVLTRDTDADGTFVYAVKTTGVYCRPSCPSRRAKPRNVVFFKTEDEAEKAGFRECLRCHPRGQSSTDLNNEVVVAACRLIEQSDQQPNLDDLAKSMGFSASHFHRQFKAATGLTPKAYGAANRMKKMRRELVKSETSVTSAIFEAGFNANSRFYENSNDALGMTPTTFRKGGKDIEIHFAVGQCSLGAILVAKSKKGICAITLGDDAERLVHDLQDRFPKANLIGADKQFEALVADVVGFVEAPKLGLNMPLDIQGTAFQQRVWQALREIPAGETVTYTDVAIRIGAPKAVRAVAQACAANKIAIAIPCHRVVRSDGSLSGYRWGVKRKRSLLNMEAQV